MAYSSRCIWTFFFVLIGALACRGDTLDQIRQRGVMRWGGDQEGGGPYIFPDPQDPNRTIGFEVELMELLAARLGVRVEFKQGEWVNLLDLLGRGDFDIAVNGYELTPQHLEKYIATEPYYIYGLQLITRKDNVSLQSWQDLFNSQQEKKVGVLGGSAAEKYVTQNLKNKVEKVNYTGTIEALTDVDLGRLDATIQDLPAAIFYENRFPRLQLTDYPVAPGYYVMYLRKGDERLRDEMNSGISELYKNGKLRALYEKYDLWDHMQKKLGPSEPGATAVQKSAEVRGWTVLKSTFPLLAQAAWVTVELSCIAMPLAIITGLLIALGRLYGPGPLRWLLTLYVEVIRGTPLMMQLFTIYFVLPATVGINLQPFQAAILGLAINYSAYEAEVYRAGLSAIPVGQLEAALALGMSRLTALRRVIVPQAVRLVIPPVTNDFIALFKDTSVCSVLTIVELSKQYNVLVTSTNAYLELASVTALLYLFMSYPLSLVARRLEGRTKRVTA
jgi:polar amino acid transport system substrate-binding protein